LFRRSYLITPMAYLSSQWTPNVQIKYFMFDWSICRLFVLNRGWKRDYLQIMIFVYICSTWSIVEFKTCFETWITRIDLKGVSLFLLSYLIILVPYLCSLPTTNFKIKYFIFHYSIYRLFVLITGCKRDSLQIMIIVNFCSTRRMVELITRVETWITRNDVNGLCFNFLL
jgi:hypothetical protein